MKWEIQSCPYCHPMQEYLNIYKLSRCSLSSCAIKSTNPQLPACVSVYPFRSFATPSANTCLAFKIDYVATLGWSTCDLINYAWKPDGGVYLSCRVLVLSSLMQAQEIKVISDVARKSCWPSLRRLLVVAQRISRTTSNHIKNLNMRIHSCQGIKINSHKTPLNALLSIINFRWALRARV